MNDISVKIIKSKDLRTFVKLWNQEYKILTSSGFKMTYEKALAGFSSKMFSYIGLYKKNLLIGFMLLKENGKEIWIKHLLVDKNERKKGLGKMLIEKAINKKAKEIFTETIKGNKAAIKFFLENNFEILKDDIKNNQFIFKRK